MSKRPKSELPPYPDNQRERDDEAIDWPCSTLDKGAEPGKEWALTKERWSVILERRIANDYGPQRSARSTWMWRHYHVRQLAHDESPERSAQHVAGVWSAHGRSVKSSTILAAAKRDSTKDMALLWIQQCLDSDRAHPSRRS